MVELAHSQARLIEAVSRFDARHSTTDVVGGAFAATLSQIKDAHSKLQVWAESGEVQLGRVVAGELQYLLKRRHQAAVRDSMATRSSDLAMRSTLAGESGTWSRSTIVAKRCWQRLSQC